MKKKFKISDILLIGAVGLILCTGFSILFKRAFGIDTDFLSASATLFAAIVAMYLYSDWREQYLISSLEKQQLEIVNLCDLLFEHYISLISFVGVDRDKNDEKTLITFTGHVQRLNNTVFKLRVAFKNYIDLLEDFEEIPQKHVAEIKRYDGFLIYIESFIDALTGVDNGKKKEQVYKQHYEHGLSDNLNVIWSSCKGEMQSFLISFLKK